MSKKTFHILFSVIIIFSLFTFLFKLGNEPFQDYDEATYASVIDMTVQSGNLLSLKISPSDYWFEKPPLQLWTGMASNKLFSSKTLAYRFPAALAGILGVVLVMLIAYVISASYGASLLAGLILLTTAGYLEAARQVRMDVPVAVSILFSFYCFLKASKNPLWYLGVGAGIGIGVMVKSVIGLFAIPIILIWCAINKQWGWLKSFHFWVWIVLMFAIILPWHVYESIHFGKIFWNDYLGHHILERFNKNILGGGITKFDYAISLFKFSIPWTILFCVGFASLVWIYKKARDKFNIFFALALIVLFMTAVFLTSNTRLIYYFTPVYPFVAVFVSIISFQIVSINRQFRWLIITIIIISVCTSSVSAYNKAAHTQSDQLQFLVLARDEKQIGLILAAHPEIKKVYIYEFPYRETLRYYSGGRSFEEYTGKEMVNQPYFLIVTWDFFDKYNILPDFQKHITKDYEGLNLILVRFIP